MRRRVPISSASRSGARRVLVGRRQDARAGQLAAEPPDVRWPRRTHAGRCADRGADPEIHVVGCTHRSAGSRRGVPLRRISGRRHAGEPAGARRASRRVRRGAARAHRGRHRHVVQPCGGQLAGLREAGGGAGPRAECGAERRAGAEAARGSRTTWSRCSRRCSTRVARGVGRLSPDRHAVGAACVRSVRAPARRSVARDRL